MLRPRLAIPATIILALIPALIPVSPARSQDEAPLTPIGEARGVRPGRVVWVHDPRATDWEGPGRGHWWEDRHTDQRIVDRMMLRAIRKLAGDSDTGEAWDRLFRYTNRKRGKGDVGYRPGERIVIKVNFVGAVFHPTWGGVNTATYDLINKMDYMNTSPQVILALLRQLVEVVGVAEEDISVGDFLSYFSNQYYDVSHDVYPRVRYLDYQGKFGRTRVRRSSLPLYWSVHPQGVDQDYLPVSVANADYVINIANLKSHNSNSGVTLCAKNHYGSLIRSPVAEGYFNLHADLPMAVPGMGHYRPLVDLMGHADLGRKTLLFLIDGLYGGRHMLEDWPVRWNSEPFHGDWSSSLFASQDQVAIDSVGLDFLRAEWDDAPHWPGVDDYLHEAALAYDPPSGTFYDPDHDGDVTRLPSLGVHEHWNHPNEKQYSRNLGTGHGIELIVDRAQKIVTIDLGSDDVVQGLRRRQNSTSETVATKIGGRDCRRNRQLAGPTPDRRIYFAVDDSFAFAGNRPELEVTVDYFDIGSGSLKLQYDAGSREESGTRKAGRIKLQDTRTWKQQTFRLTDAFFGNRQNTGADFRIVKKGAAEYFYIDVVRLAVVPPTGGSQEVE